MAFWDSLDPKYSLILCDVWGVVHDGARLYPGAADRLHQWRRPGRKVILITNAPRTADAVEAQLRRFGLSDDHWDGISTSGEAGIAAIQQLDRPAGFLGTREDREILEGRGLRFADEGFAHIAVTGLDDERDRVDGPSVTLSDVGFHGFMYVGGDVENAGGGSTLVGAIFVNGTITTNTTTVYYDQSVTNNIKLTNATVSRSSWDEIRVSW